MKKKVAAKKIVKKTAKKTSGKKGSKLSCGVCGLSVTVDHMCGCEEVHPIICCGQAMKPKKR